MYESAKIFRNIRAIVKMQGRGMNEIETEVGVNPGYCLGHMNRASRKKFSNGMGRDKANLEIIWRFSRVLGVSINDLIEKDFDAALTKGEKE